MNVIWITSDTFRRDHIGAYGNKQIQTPALDLLAEKSVRFQRHYAAGFPTMPTRADHFSGRWTMSFMGWSPLPSNVTTLAEILSENGLHTAAVVDTPFYMRDGMNYDRGFRSFFMGTGQEGSGAKKLKDGRHESQDTRAAWRFESDYNSPQTFIKAMQWLEHHYKEDFFLYVDTWDPHEPWDAPSYYTEIYRPDYDGEIIEPIYGFWKDVPGFTQERLEKAHATYCGEITMVDTWLGYFLRRAENMGLMENTAIIFTSDHGFYFGEHGGLFGKMV
ncbi:MAG: sulfatase, partial [Desulfobacterales bacterium]